MTSERALIIVCDRLHVCDEEVELKLWYHQHLSQCPHDNCMDCENAVYELKGRDILVEQAIARLSCANTALRKRWML
jgi:hypothetical protein